MGKGQSLKLAASYYIKKTNKILDYLSQNVYNNRHLKHFLLTRSVKMFIENREISLRFDFVLIVLI